MEGGKAQGKKPYIGKGAMRRRMGWGGKKKNLPPGGAPAEEKAGGDLGEIVSEKDGDHQGKRPLERKRKCSLDQDKKPKTGQKKGKKKN